MSKARRRAPQKRAGDVVYVCVEGETELGYLEDVRRRLRLPRGRLVVERAKGTSFANVKKTVEKKCPSSVLCESGVRVDARWCVADTELDGSWRGVATRPAPGEARSGSMRWALSSASFERWLLLHFEPWPPALDAAAGG